MTDIVKELAAENNLADDDFLEMYSLVNVALKEKFPDAVDSGIGRGWCDFWIKRGDVEYKLVMKPHRSLKATQ